MFWFNTVYYGDRKVYPEGIAVGSLDQSKFRASGNSSLMRPTELDRDRPRAESWRGLANDFHSSQGECVEMSCDITRTPPPRWEVWLLMIASLLF